MLYYWCREGHFSQDVSWIITVVYFKDAPYRVSSSEKSEKELNIQTILAGGSINIGNWGPWGTFSILLYPNGSGADHILPVPFFFPLKREEKNPRSLKRLFTINHEVKPSQEGEWETEWTFFIIDKRQSLEASIHSKINLSKNRAKHHEIKLASTVSSRTEIRSKPYLSSGIVKTCH